MLSIIRQVLNQAFALSLNKDECIEPARKIFELVREKLKAEQSDNINLLV